MSVTRLVLSVLPLVLVVMATSQVAPHQSFLCMKKQTGEGSKLISEKQSSDRAACRESCSGECVMAVFQADTGRCALYTHQGNTLPQLTHRDTATTMVKSGLSGRSCDASYNCYRGRSDSYQGRVNVTKSGVACQKWSSQTPHQHNRYNSAKDFVDFALPDNFCRSAVGENYAPWCYTSDPNTRWDYCDVKQCDKECCHNDVQEEKMEILQVSLDSLHHEIDDKDKDIDTLQSEKSDMKGQLTNLDNHVTDHGKQITDLENSADSRGKQLSSLEAQMTAMQAKISALQAAKTSQQSQLDTLHTAKSSTDSQLNSLRSKVNSLNSQLSAPAQLKRKNCKWTGYVNDWDKRLQWTAPGKAVVVGTQSYHDNGKEDRLWKFYHCELTV